MSLPQEPLGIRRRGSSPLVRYSYLHSHSTPLHGGFPHRFTAEIDAPLPIRHPQPEGGWWQMTQLRLCA
jgi:hypothetical protein